MTRGTDAIDRALPALVIVLVAAGYVACFAGVAISPALVSEPDRWLGVPNSAPPPWLEATIAHALYWLVVLVAASACVAMITWVGSAALRQLAEAERATEEHLCHIPRRSG